MGKASLLLRLALALALVWSAPACSRAEGALLSQREFQERVAQEITRQHPGAEISKVGSSQLVIHLLGKEPMTYNLDRVYAVYQGNPDELGTIIQNMATAIEAEGRPATAESLIVLVRPASFGPAAGPGGSQDRALSRPVAGDLLALVALDHPDSYAIMPASDLREQLNMDDATIWARAMANTRARLEFKPRPLQPGRIGEISTGEGLASSLLAEDAFWDAPEMTAGGPVVVAPFERDVLFLTLLSDADSVRRLRSLMADVRDDPNGLTSDLLVRRGGRWEVLR